MVTFVTETTDDEGKAEFEVQPGLEVVFEAKGDQIKGYVFLVLSRS